MATKARAVPLFETTRDLSGTRKFIAAMTILAAKNPAYHTILVGRDIIWCKCGTAATDGVFIYVDPDFWESLPNDQLMPVFEATVQAVEEAIINAMVAAETMEGINGNKAYALPHDLLIKTLKKYNRLKE